MRRTVRAIAAMTAVLIVGGAGALPAAAATATLRGTITMDGCSITPSDLIVRAQAPGAGGHRRARTAVADPSRNRTASIGATSDPQTVTFSITGLTKGRLYHLAIQHHAAARAGDGPCGRVFWRGPHEGLVVAGGGSVAIRGLAARTQLEVRRPGRTDGWFGADDLDLTDPESSVRSVRWRTSIPSAVAGELQLALDPFPVVASGNACAEPRRGVVARVPLDAERGGAWSETRSLDLAAILVPSRATVVRARHVPAGTVTEGLTRDQKRAVLAGAPIWMRVVPQAVDGPICATHATGVLGWAILASVRRTNAGETPDPPEAPTLKLATGHRYEAPYFDPKKHPSNNESAWLVVRSHTLPSWSKAHSLTGIVTDPLGAMLVQLEIWPGGTTLQPGAWFWIDPGEPSWWDDLTDSVGDLVTGVIDAVGFMVDTVSKTYAQIKKAAAAVALKVLQATPIVAQACAAAPSVCKQAIEAGIDAALSSVGLPPSLPNWEQVQGMALDYAAAELASQTGIPPDLSKAAYKELASQALKKVADTKGGKGVQYNWVEPYFGTDPAVERLVLTAGGALPANLLLEREASELFLGDILPIPRRLRGTVGVPMVLQADTSGMGTPDCGSLLGNPMPCGDAYRTRWYRNKVFAALKASTCERLNTFSRAWLWPPAIVPTKPALAISSLVMVEPRTDASWNGKVFSSC